VNKEQVLDSSKPLPDRFDMKHAYAAAKAYAGRSLHNKGLRQDVPNGCRMARVYIARARRAWHCAVPCKVFLNDPLKRSFAISGYRAVGTRE
jgi:hypothetical protein